MNGLMVAFLIGFFGGVANLLVDIPALWHYNWNNGTPNYKDLMAAPHRYLHTPIFCLLVSLIVWIGFITLVYGLGMG